MLGDARVGTGLEIEKDERLVEDLECAVSCGTVLSNSEQSLLVALDDVDLRCA